MSHRLGSVDSRKGPLQHPGHLLPVLSAFVAFILFPHSDSMDCPQAWVTHTPLFSADLWVLSSGLA